MVVQQRKDEPWPRGDNGLSGLSAGRAAAARGVCYEPWRLTTHFRRRSNIQYWRTPFGNLEETSVHAIQWRKDDAATCVAAQ